MLGYKMEQKVWQCVRVEEMVNNDNDNDQNDCDDERNKDRNWQKKSLIKELAERQSTNRALGLAWPDKTWAQRSSKVQMEQYLGDVWRRAASHYCIESSVV